jgi:hypothetical protein
VVSERVEMLRMQIGIAGQVFVHEFPVASLPGEAFPPKALDMMDQMYQNVKDKVAKRFEEGL